MNTEHDFDLGDDLVITKTTRRNSGGGTWVDGTLAGHRFQALVFPQHAESPEYEMDDSRISKLWLQDISDRTMVANFDRAGTCVPRRRSPQRSSIFSPPAWRITSTDSPHRPPSSPTTPPRGRLSRWSGFSPSLPLLANAGPTCVHIADGSFRPICSQSVAKRATILGNRGR